MLWKKLHLENDTQSKVITVNYQKLKSLWRNVETKLHEARDKTELTETISKEKQDMTQISIMKIREAVTLCTKLKTLQRKLDVENNKCMP